MSDRPWPLGEPDEPARADLLRLLLLGTLGVELFTQVAHAAKYGAGHFNVGHFPALDRWVSPPEGPAVVVILLSLAFVALRAALGVGLRGGLPLLAVGYGGLYFSSQIDSYQHHYLLALLLGVLSVGLWLEPGAPARFPGWSLALVRAQIAVVYLWATVAKLHPEWLGGEVLLSQLGTTDRGLPWLEAAAGAVGLTPLALAQAGAWGVCVAEAVLVVGWLWRPLWPLALPLGLALHGGIEVLGFEIGLFSWFMFGLYTLLLPARWVAWLGRWLPGPEAPGAQHLAPLVGGVGAGGLALGLPVEQPWTLACFWFALSVLLGGGSWRTAGAGLAAAALLLGLGRQTDTLRDYHRYLGGDARRRGDLETALYAYGQVVTLDPSYFSGWVRLADLQVAAGRLDLALPLLEQARALEPRNAEALSRLLALYSQNGDRTRAVAAAQALLEVEPGDAAALEALERFRAAPP